MKTLTLKLVLPLTIISFFGINKWWYVDVIDGTDEIMYGFPFIYTCRAFHTSLASQYFILEYIADLLFYFLIIWSLVFVLHKYFNLKSISKLVFYGLLIICIPIVFTQLLIFVIFDNTFDWIRDFDINFKSSGVNFFFDYKERPC
ncbi:MAG: hypothetical protein KYX68_12085 [Flavobacterium sp.]|nr:hypothetical protein [Flavobacterium sp.]